ncbi:hypothetical protein B0H13DRAFT_1864439 [Mycena leptocephala]|nr:hypothetical protein B0H13DRAFT_1864439 [Mycena leptocephala]
MSINSQVSLEGLRPRSSTWNGSHRGTMLPLLWNKFLDPHPKRTHYRVQAHLPRESCTISTEGTLVLVTVSFATYIMADQKTERGVPASDKKIYHLLVDKLKILDYGDGEPWSPTPPGSRPCRSSALPVLSRMYDGRNTCQTWSDLKCRIRASGWNHFKPGFPGVLVGCQGPGTAALSSPYDKQRLSVHETYVAMEEKFPYYQTTEVNWKNNFTLWVGRTEADRQANMIARQNTHRPSPTA